MNLPIVVSWLALTSVSLHGKTVQIPDALKFSDGRKVATVDEWRRHRRPEILELFRREVYGRAPVGRPDDLKFEVTDIQKDAMGGAATRKRIEISFGAHNGKAGKIHLLLFVLNRIKKAAPCFVLLNNRGPQNIDATRQNKSDFWPAEMIIARGYAAAAFQLSDLDPDKDDGFQDGVHGLFDGGKRAPDAWGTIAAWAWGASRVMDYLRRDVQIDAARVALVGHSRGGKTALWASAQDERFALTISNDSGSTGAALARGKAGENIAKINQVFPHWFCENYKKYNDRENDLPVDQHQLLALVAPRLLYIASASEDENADPAAEWQSGVAASPVYELFGLRGLPDTALPALETPLLEGQIGHHVRTGAHDLTPYDWARFLDFADSHFNSLR